ncbi:hypothetical protein CcrSwift_gp241 [Caulobacter phage CcrSwift]|uniref:Uncharacterized protein n=6 Tax=Viruses TaxID=10239 RepID=J3SMK9_9CAUD|nr:hypothetical protein D865_gp183 [Caulobacter phage phiCbK]YP_006989974.1 hypothetical protein D870_gp180 [Caulobacter phage CcrSwift]ARB15148.1 hypothetical protein Ccr32_gp230 [Caulobacter phage Ccr32]ARB15482.1 hypothetical protein Ccr34_gp240 [Caulobacter phage Ccr34]AFO71600.1 hypothetical protein phiCbK_086 [Caulobacter phage phiCbK]AFU87067.1 hypothetical protein CbK_gp235 [Caulobacter phage phiCbK]AFU88559.1 hypothetical protein CcrSwift_gp241 [Caulobacter phage CcrSwift]
MIFSSKTQPHCRCCAKPIKKHTRRHYFGSREAKDNGWSLDRIETPMSEDELRRLVNGHIVSFAWSHDVTYDANYKAVRKKTHIAWANVWDGETYEDGYFCTLRCAAAFGSMVAEHYPDIHTQAYADFKDKR